MKTTAFGILVLGLLLVSSAFVLSLPSASASTPTPAVAAAYSFNLYGSVTGGWGLTPTSISEPGPSLTMFVGDSVTVHLYSNDSATHTWFIDLTKDGTNGTGDISSADFSSPTAPLTFTFTVPDSPGTYTYYCNIHPGSMHGPITIVAAPTFVLYGSSTAGWGTSSSAIQNPGPLLSAHQGDVVTFELVSADGAQHSFFIDVDHSGAAPDASDPQSPSFGGSAFPVTSWSYTVAAAPGNYTYYCGFHGSAMEGPFQVLSTGGGAAPSTPDYTLYAAVILVIVVIAVAAMVVIRRKPRMPPAQPPQ